jgi:hypothetical protein
MKSNVQGMGGSHNYQGSAEEFKQKVNNTSCDVFDPKSGAGRRESVLYSLISYRENKTDILELVNWVINSFAFRNYTNVEHFNSMSDVVNLTATLNEDKLLHAAAARGLIDVAEFLIEHGASIEAVNKQGKTPLCSAFFSGIDMVRMLLEKGAKIETLQQLPQLVDDPKTMKHKASWEFLIENIGGNVDNNQILETAIRNDMVDVVKYLVNNRFSKLTELAYPIYNAFDTGKIELIGFLLEKYNINVVDKKGETALFHATKREHYKTAKDLIEKGASGCDKAFASSWTANSSELIKFFIEHGANAMYLQNSQYTQKIKDIGIAMQMICKGKHTKSPIGNIYDLTDEDLTFLKCAQALKDVTADERIFIKNITTNYVKMLLNQQTVNHKPIGDFYIHLQEALPESLKKEMLDCVNDLAPANPIAGIQLDVPQHHIDPEEVNIKIAGEGDAGEDPF